MKPISFEARLFTLILTWDYICYNQRFVSFTLSESTYSTTEHLLTNRPKEIIEFQRKSTWALAICAFQWPSISHQRSKIEKYLRVKSLTANYFGMILSCIRQKRSSVID